MSSKFQCSEFKSYKKYGLIGHPVKNSLSPVIQKEAFLSENIDAEYVLYDVLPKSLNDFLNKAAAEEIRGLNVTMPHKENVMKYVECDEISKKIGAVNTLLLKNGKYTGYNTDAWGFYDSLKNHVSDIFRKEILIIGAGGAARAIAYSLINEGASISIVNRTEKRSESLVKEINKTNDKKYLNESKYSKFSILKKNEMTLENLSKFDIFINATSLGMNDSDLSPWNFLIEEAADGFLNDSNDILNNILNNILNSKKVLFDVVYSKNITPYLSEGKKRNAICIDGKEMLLNQGARSFEIWTGKKANLEKMKNALERYMSN